MQPPRTAAESGQRPPEVWSVDAITGRLKSLVEGAFRRVSVEGEVVSCRPASSGHVYFTLRGRNAALHCVLFRSAAQRLGRAPGDGDQLICTGDIELYPPSGKYQLVVQWVRWGGEGELLAAFEALKRRLHAEGLFDQARKRRLPYLPRRIAVVTSPSGAAIRDVVKSIHERFPLPILLSPAPVQGSGAALRIARAMQLAASVDDVDVVVVCRGGGGIQDLWEFNDEGLARAVAACPKPVVSAVGHEIDTVLTDLTADARAATPTSVGELLVPVHGELLEWIALQRDRCARAVSACARQTRTRMRSLEARLADPRRLLREHWQRLDELDGRLERALLSCVRQAGARLGTLVARLSDPRRLLREERQRKGELHRRLEMAVLSRLRHERARLSAASRRLAVMDPAARLRRERTDLGRARARLVMARRAAIERHEARLRQLGARLRALGPLSSLERGYAIVRRAERREVIRSAREVSVGDALEIVMADGVVRATATGTGRDCEATNPGGR